MHVIIILFGKKCCIILLHLVSASKIRLVSSYQGFIQIKDGSTWRYVKEENWDKKRQKMLCQYLGFSGSEIKEIASPSRLSSGNNIATGHLICYKPRSKEASCCVHLTPYKNENIVWIPYAKCECTFMIDKCCLVLDSRFLACGLILWLLDLYVVAVVCLFIWHGWVNYF